MHRTSRTSRTIGHHSFVAGGRPTVAPPRAVPVPGPGRATRSRPRRAPRSSPRSRGRSSTRRRRTGRPRSGPGRSGPAWERTDRPEPDVPGEAAPGCGAGRSVARWPRRSRRRGGRRHRRKVRGCDRVDTEQIGRGEGPRLRQAVPGTSSATDPSGAGHGQAGGAGRDLRSTGVPGWTASAGAADPPSSSPVRFASRIGKATWSGRSERRGSNARTAVGSPSRTPAYSRGRPWVPG